MTNVNRRIIALVFILLCSIFLSLDSSAQVIELGLEAKPAGPEQFLTLFAEATDTKIESKASSIAQLEDLLEKKNLDSNSRAGLHLELATHYLTEYLHVYEENKTKYRRVYIDWAVDGMNGEKPLVHSEVLAVTARKSVLNFRKALKSNSKLRKNPRFLTTLGMSMLAASNPNASIYFNLALKVKRNNVWRTWSHLGLATDSYLSGQFDRSSKTAKKIKNSKYSKYQNYSNYLHAWSLIPRDGKPIPKRTIALFKELSKKTGTIREVAMSSLIYVWSEQNSPVSAKKFFGETPHYFATLSRISDVANGRNKFNSASKSLAKIVGKNTQAERGQLALARIAKFQYKAKNYKLLVRTLTQMEKNLSIQNEWFTDAGYLTKDEVRKLTQNFLLKFSKKLHSDAATAESRVVIESAVQIYTVFFKRWSKGNEELRSKFAEALEAAGHNEQAVKQHLIVAKSTKGTELQQYSVRKMYKLQKGVVLSKPMPVLKSYHGKKKPKSLPTSFALFVTVSDFWIGTFGENKLAPAIAQNTSQIMLRFGHIDDSIKRKINLLEKWPTASNSLRVVKSLTSIWRANNNLNPMITWSRQIIADNEVDSQAKNYIFNNLKDSIWKRAEKHVRSKEFRLAGTEFYNFGSEFERDRRADAALNLSYRNYSMVGDGKLAINSAKYLVANFSSSKFRPNMKYGIGQIYEQMLEYENAALAFREFANQFGSDRRAPVALYKSAGLFADMGNHDATVDVYNELIETWPRHSLSRRSLLKLAESFVILGQNDNAIEAFRYTAEELWAKDVEISLFARARAAEMAKVGMEFAAVEAAVRGKKRTFAVKARNILVRFKLEELAERHFGFPNTVASYADLVQFKASENQINRKTTSMMLEIADLEPIASTELLPLVYYTKGLYYQRSLAAFNGEASLDDLPDDEVLGISDSQEKTINVLRHQATKSFKKARKIADLFDVPFKMKKALQQNLVNLDPNESDGSLEGILSPSSYLVELSNLK